MEAHNLHGAVFKIDFGARRLPEFHGKSRQAAPQGLRLNGDGVGDVLGEDESWRRLNRANQSNGMLPD